MRNDIRRSFGQLHEKKSFDRLVRIGKHDKRYPQDRKIACSSIIEDISNIYFLYFEIILRKKK